MRVVFVGQDQEPRLVSIPSTLSAMQGLVRGRIEAVEPFEDDDVVLICSETARIEGKPVNRVITDRIDICGDFFICGQDGEELCSIPENRISKYISMFSERQHTLKGVDTNQNG